MKSRFGLLAWIGLIFLFTFGSAVSVQQTIEPDGTIVLNGDILPVYRVTLKLTDLETGRVTIEMGEEMRSYFRFLDCNNDPVDRKMETDQKLLREDGTAYISFVNVRNRENQSTISINSSGHGDTCFFTYYLCPKSRQELDDLARENESVFNRITVNETETSAAFRVSVPRLSLELLNDPNTLGTGNLESLSYRLIFNDAEETLNSGMPISISCNLLNQAADVYSISLPAGTGFRMEGDNILFTIPDGEKTVIVFSTVPYFRDAEPGFVYTGKIQTTVKAGVLGDAIRREIRYTPSLNEYSLFLDILAVNSRDYTQRVQDASFEVQHEGKTEKVSGQPLVTTTNDNGYTRLINILDTEGTSAWQIYKDEEYQLVEVSTPEGYLPLDGPVPFIVGDVHNPAEGRYRSGEVLMIPYTEGVMYNLEGRYSLAGRVMRQNEIREFTLVPVNDEAKDGHLVELPTDCTVTVSGNSLTGRFSFPAVTFFAPGTYMFEICQADLSAVGITHESNQVLAIVTVDRDELTGGLKVAETCILKSINGTDTESDELVLADTYSASCEYSICGRIELDGGAPDGNAFYAVLMRNGEEIDRTECQTDGSFTFRPILFGTEMAGTTYDFEVLPGQLTEAQRQNGMILVSEPCEIHLAVEDDGLGRINVTETGDTPLCILYEHVRTLHIAYRVHQCPPAEMDMEQPIRITVDTQMDARLEVIKDGEHTLISGNQEGETTVFEAAVKGDTELILPEIPVGAQFSMSFPEAMEGAQAAFTYAGQTYLTQQMKGSIGACIPDYEALMIFPFGTYTPSVNLHSLSEMDLSTLRFGLKPANDETLKAMQEGWVCFPDGAQMLEGTPDVLSETDAVIRFGDTDIQFFKEGSYCFECIPLDTDTGAVDYEDRCVRIDLEGTCTQTDMITVTEQNQPAAMICYPVDHLNVSVLDASFPDAYQISVLLQHPAFDLTGRALRVDTNGEKTSVVLSDGRINMQVHPGDEFTLFLPHGTKYVLEMDADDLQTELIQVGEEELNQGTLLAEKNFLYAPVRKNAELRITVQQTMERNESGKLRICFFESEVPVPVENVQIEVNDQAEQPVQGCLSVTDDDVVNIAGRLAGLVCEAEMLEPVEAITLLSTDNGSFTETNRTRLILETGKTHNVSIAQTLVPVHLTGCIRVLGDTLTDGCFEMVIEDEKDGATETIQCPASEDGQHVLSGMIRYLQATGTYSYRIREKAVKSLPMMIMDRTEYLVRYAVETGENGTVTVHQTLSQTDESGMMQSADEILFTNVKLYPLKLSSETVNRSTPMTFKVRIRNAGKVTKYPYTIGTKNGQIESGESLTLLNEQCTIWVPFGAEYEISALPSAGYSITQGNGEPLTGVIGSTEQAIHMTARYEPETVLDEEKTSLTGQVLFADGEWADETFTLSLVPADEETRAAMGSGFRFTNGMHTLDFTVSKDSPDFTISVIGKDGEGIEALQAGSYLFSLKQSNTSLENIVMDTHEERLILTVTDDGEGHLFPELHFAEQQTDGMVFKNFAQAVLAVSCTVSSTQPGNAYELRKLPFVIALPALTDGPVTATIQTGNEMKTCQMEAVKGQIQTELSHGEMLRIPGLSTGEPYSIHSEAVPGYETDPRTKRGTLAYGSPAEEVFSFNYNPTTEVVIHGSLELRYRQPEPAETATFALTPSDDVTREAFGEEFSQTTTIPLNTSQKQMLLRSAASVTPATGKYDFSFKTITFNRTGTYLFDLRQSDNAVGNTRYDDSCYQVRVTVTDPQPGSGMLKAEQEILLNGQPSELSFTNEYEASGEAVFSGQVIPFERTADAGEFQFELLDEEGTVVSRCTNEKDGSFSFKPISFQASDIGQVRYYRIRQRKGTAGGVTYDVGEYRAVTAIRDAGEGKMTVAVAYSKRGSKKAWIQTDSVRFENHYSAEGSLVIDTSLSILGRSFLLGETFNLRLFQKDPSGEWLEIDSATLSPEGKKQADITYEELEFTLSDVAEAPLQYKIQLDGSLTSFLQPEGTSERFFEVELTDLRDGTLKAVSSLTEEDAVFSLMSYTERSVTCEFDDENNRTGARPAFLEVRLLANDEESDCLELNDENNWAITTGYLPMADSEGRNIKYTIDVVPSRPYGLTLSGDDVSGYIITARYRPHNITGSDPKGRLDAPETGDRLHVVSFFTGLSAAGILLIAIFVWTRKGKQ